jgi:hypothetical protein
LKEGSGGSIPRIQALKDINTQFSSSHGIFNSSMIR